MGTTADMTKQLHRARTSLKDMEKRLHSVNNKSGE